jgi:hypothetical protein
LLFHTHQQSVGEPSTDSLSLNAPGGIELDMVFAIPFDQKLDRDLVSFVCLQVKRPGSGAAPVAERDLRRNSQGKLDPFQPKAGVGSQDDGGHASLAVFLQAGLLDLE